MLAFQTMNTKRRRDDDSDSEDERYLKKSRSWTIQTNNVQAQYPSPAHIPLRPGPFLTPSPPQIASDPEVMTPAQSEPSEAGTPTSIHDDPLVLSSPHNDMDYAMQIDEDDMDMISSPTISEVPTIATNFRPAKLDPNLFNREPTATGRIPTPIYPSFNSVAANGYGYPNSGLAGSMSMSNGFLGPPPAHPAPLMQPPPRKQSVQMEQDRSRRMPSPISEDEDIPDTPTALTQSQLSRLSMNHNSSDQMDGDMVRPIAVPPTPRGRKRSGALLGAGRFSMGYREDCEKCRQRVPGHYSHFLP